jgi:hypothetical protein
MLKRDSSEGINVLFNAAKIRGKSCFEKLILVDKRGICKE